MFAEQQARQPVVRVLVAWASAPVRPWCRAALMPAFPTHAAALPAALRIGVPCLCDGLVVLSPVMPRYGCRPGALA